MEINKNLIGKKVKITLNNNAMTFYHGRIVSLGNEYLHIVDKFDNPVYIPISNILAIEELT
jgi:hypothetical protein